ncbi:MULTISPECIES: regulatory protein RecX [unclassified Coleofasciculus]|uniref:regulatory protein RecX n=1 Tax=Cyanophyceae TaxID=3028117 RepID=UPI001687FEC9|nr:MULTISPECIES: regulatory protein RecX [unclassified Coleofasciculus]MBD1881752.1 regulatory protein RecX [Coleofasciculus sp. FACHB-T130]MBD1889517.1 regulatory protein RecX [Coleofasciculus sp. FACHB-SPT9]MBD1945541.1 regulatory protein RecX [Coleofasciculus sp. FACHB-712]
MSCTDYFFRLISRRDYSAYELLKKGQLKGFEPNEISEAINYLQERDYQSDTRLVANLIAYSQGKYGKSMVRRKCMEKGISSEVFEQVWNEQIEAEGSEETDDLDGLKTKIMRKYKIDDFQIIDQKTKAKLLNYLQYRGFNAFEVLKQWQRQQVENE